MLKNTKAFSSFSVNDLDKAEDFYSKTLGLDVQKEDMGILSVHTGGGTFMIYPKDDHKPATYTVLNFPVSDIEKVVGSLKAKGVTFEQYDQPQLKTDADGIARQDHGNMAWFKDPAGNVLGVMEEQK